MTRTTIDFGIDLGTTNSTIAVYKDGEVEVFRNNEGSEYTPSAVWVDKNNQLIVGRAAKERLEDDPGNAISGFKRLMGTADKKTFARSGQSMTPEELSAEVLKELKGVVRQRTNEEVTAAVITVPADFDLPQCEATKRAAKLAGLTLCPLLQEPVAAALAYGFQSQSDKVFWLVYDFGGGTFDAAVIQVRDGAIEVVNHGGDNSLGGKDIDWAIVERLLVPALTNECKLTNFKRGNSQWRSVFAKLKWHTKEAILALSRRKTTYIDIKFSAEDNFPAPFQFGYVLQQSEVDEVAESFIGRTINICRKVLADKRLERGSIEKMIMVGEATLAPHLRERLSDKVEGLGIPLESNVDPTTVVARGAAIFAATQSRVPRDEAGKDKSPQVTKPPSLPRAKAIPDDKVKVTKPPSLPRVEAIQNEKAKIAKPPLSPANAKAIRKSKPFLEKSIGLVLLNDEIKILFKKSAPLPVRERVLFHTTRNFHKGQAEDLIHISVLDIENKSSNMDHLISTLEIKSSQVKRDVPSGSEIEVAVVIDKFYTLWIKAYISVLDEEFEAVVQMDE